MQRSTARSSKLGVRRAFSVAVLGLCCLAAVLAPSPARAEDPLLFDGDTEKLLGYFESLVQRTESRHAKAVLRMIQSDMKQGYLTIRMGWPSHLDSPTSAGQYLDEDYFVKGGNKTTGHILMRKTAVGELRHINCEDDLVSTLMHEFGHHVYGSDEVRACEFEALMRRKLGLKVSEAKADYVWQMQRKLAEEVTARRTPVKWQRYQARRHAQDQRIADIMDGKVTPRRPSSMLEALPDIERFAAKPGSRVKASLSNLRESIHSSPGVRFAATTAVGVGIDLVVRNSLQARGHSDTFSEYGGFMASTVGVAAFEHLVFGASYASLAGGAVIAGAIYIATMMYEVYEGIYARINEPGFNGFTPEEDDAWLMHVDKHGWDYVSAAWSGFWRSHARYWSQEFGW